MTQRVATDVLGDFGHSGGFSDCALQHCLVKMVASPLSGRLIDAASRGGEDPLPRQILGEIWVFESERVRELDEPATASAVFLMLAPDELQLVLQHSDDANW